MIPHFLPFLWFLLLFLLYFHSIPSNIHELFKFYLKNVYSFLYSISFQCILYFDFWPPPYHCYQQFECLAILGNIINVRKRFWRKRSKIEFHSWWIFNFPFFPFFLLFFITKRFFYLFELFILFSNSHWTELNWDIQQLYILNFPRFSREFFLIP